MNSGWHLFKPSLGNYVFNRQLRLFNPTRPEIVIANNSGIFFSLASLKYHGKSSHPNLRIILPEFWLDKVHSDYDGLDWGQTIRGIPWYARQEFFEIYPNHEADKLITWKQYKELRKYVIEKLISSGIPLLHGTPSIMKNNDNSYNISIGTEKFHSPSNTYFYNVFRKPNIQHGMEGLPEISHTQLYCSPREQVPSSIIVAGSGRSTKWLCDHFPLSNFTCIKRPKAEFVIFDGEELPSNLEIINSDIIGPGKDLEASTYQEKGKTISYLSNLKNPTNSFVGEFYCAIGLMPDLGVTKVVPDKNLLIYPYHNKFDWFAPDFIPVGSLLESTLRWAVSTENLSWAFETHCYHENYFINIFISHMEKKGIVLPLLFFDELRKCMLRIYEDQAGKKVKSIPDDEQIIKIYKSCFKESSNLRHDSPLVKRFESSLRETVEERTLTYQKDKNFKPS